MTESNNRLVEGGIYTMPTYLLDCRLGVERDSDTVIEFLLRLGDELEQQSVYG